MKELIVTNNNWTRNFILLFTLVFVIVNDIFSFNITIDGKIWYFRIINSTEVSVVYQNYGQSGSSSSYNPSNNRLSGVHTIPESVTYGGVVYSVVEIQDHAFYGLYLSGTFIIPNSIRKIGGQAFGSTGIDTLIIGDNVILLGEKLFLRDNYVDPFSGNSSVPENTSLKYCYIGCENTAQWGGNPFAKCTGLNTVFFNAKKYNGSFSSLNVQHLIIGDSVNIIPASAFKDCGLIGKLSIPNNVDSILENAFSNCPIDTLVLGDSICFIGANAFKNCTHIKGALVLPNKLESIQSNAFFGCSSIESIVSNETLPFIGESAFQNCTAVTSLILGDSIEDIGDFAFKNCSQIMGYLNFPGSIETIGTQAFSNCDNIIGIRINDAVVVVGESAFQDCDRLVMVDLGDSATSIGESAFQNCFRLNSMQMGNAVTSIGDNAFNGCVRLPFPTLSSSLVSIGTSAFQGCSVVQGNLTFPSNISTIGNNAFAQCGNITSLTMKSATPPTIFANTFSGISTSIPVYVPCGCVLNYYVTNYWENFSNILEAQPYEITTSVNENLMGVAQVTTGPTCANHSAVITASANSGFHFVRWSDGNSINPRLVYLTQDTSFTAIFAVNNIYITVHSSDSVKGTVEGSGVYSYNGLAVLSATANATYHFLRWNDGNTDNPRYVFATQDSSFTAIFVSNASYITVGNYNPEMGTVSGGGLYYYMQQISIMAIPNYGYHFFQWNDGNMQNPRPIIVNCDTSFMAYFAPNIYSIAVNSNNTTMGTVTGSGNYNYNMFISITATANYGYHFTQWNDGNTNNPRSLTVTCDSAFTAQFAANTYQITVTPNDPLMGGAYGSGTYTYNSQTTISASPTYGYHFVQWNDGSTENPRTISVTHNAQYEAQFAVNFYTINVASNNPAIGTASGGGNYSYNSIINLVATPNYGYHFTQWSDGNTDNPRTVTVMQNATYTAQFAINTYTVSVGQNNASMGVVSGSGNYIYNTLATISATPYYGYHFTQWNDGNTENPRTVLVSQNMTFTAQFDVNTYNLSVISNNITAGYTTGSGTYNYNDIVAITAIPAPHYHFVAWSDSVMENPRNVIITKDTLYTALFTIDAHTVSATPNNSVMGSVQGAGSYDYGTNVALRAIPNYGYHFVQWNDGVTQNPRHFTLFTDTSFVAQFGVNTYTATILSGDTLMGSVSNSGTYNYLTQLTLTATPVFGYHFDHWSDGSTDNPRTLTLTRDTVIMAYFAINMYQVDLAVNDSTLGNVSGAGTYPYLTQVIVSASANEHCHFVQWSDGSTSNPRQFSIIGDVSLTAEFAEDDKFTIQVFSSDENMGYVSVGGEYYVGTQISISAFPFEHYQFLHWSDGVTDNPRTVTVLENAVFTAVFAPVMYDITVLSSNETMGNVYGGGSFAYGTTIEISATPNEGYHFECWSDGDSTPVRSVIVDGNQTYIANFAEGVSIDEWNAETVKVFPNPTTDNVFITHPEVERVEVLGISGQIVKYNQGMNQISIGDLPPGIYVLRVYIGNQEFHRRIIKQ
ncbi:MAG: leucine-rich repeat protein [Bacteroidales bacterium]|nr:leucine-rich repeat protein [Bacteroidales bacterium]